MRGEVQSDPWCPNGFHIVFFPISLNSVLNFLLKFDFAFTHQVTIVRPDSKLEFTHLLIKWKILNINVTLSFVNGRGFPSNCSIGF